MPDSAIPFDTRYTRRGYTVRTALFYCAIFVSAAVFGPFFPLWLTHHGIEPTGISIILSTNMLIGVILTPVFAMIADRSPDRAIVLTILCWLTFAFACGFLLTPTFWGVLAAVIGLSVFGKPQVPLAEAITLSGVRRYGVDYATARMPGSIVFMVCAFVAGFGIEKIGIDAWPLVYVPAVILPAFVALAMPRVGRPRYSTPIAALAQGGAFGLLRSRPFVTMLTASSLVGASHAMLHGFSSIYWSQLGYSGAWIGAFWAVSVIAEVAFFRVSSRFIARFGARNLLMAAGLAGAARWFLFPLLGGGWFGATGFLVIQLAHALTYAAAHLCTQHLIVRDIDEGDLGAAQSLVFLTTNLTMGLLIAAGGPLYVSLGGFSFWTMAVMSAAAAVAAWQLPEGEVQ
ncbi:MAG TPA: MFS transporter [Rhizobiaceae bacterium]|nr:MFS transporter [Rhizobiaceae bacterium]